MFYKLRTDIFKFLNLIAMYLILTYNTALQKNMLWLTIICMTHFLCGLHADISLFCFFFLLEKEDVETLTVKKEMVSMQYKIYFHWN